MTLAEIYCDVVLEISLFLWSPGACCPVRLVSGDGGTDGADVGLVEDAGGLSSPLCTQKRPHYN